MAQMERSGILQTYQAAQIDSPTKLRQRLQAQSSISPLVDAILNKDQSKVTAILETRDGEASVDDGLTIARGYTPLILSCGYGLKDISCSLVQAGADTNKIIIDELTPLVVAIQSGDLELVQFLVEEHATAVSPTDAAGPCQLSPVHVACFFGRLDIVRYLVEHVAVSVRLTDKYGVTPLIIALMRNQFDVTDYLLNGPFKDKEDCLLKLNLNHKSVHGDTALTICMQKYRDHESAPRLARRMIDCGANPTIPTMIPGRTPESPLSLAVQYADFQFIKDMLDNSTRPDQGPQYGAFALALKLSLQRDKRCVQLLLRSECADPNYGYDPRTLDTCMHELGRLLASRTWTDHDFERDMIRLFLESGGEVNSPNKQNDTFCTLIEKRRDLWQFVPTLAAQLNPDSDAPANGTRPNAKRKRGTSEMNGVKKHPKKNSKKKGKSRENGASQQENHRTSNSDAPRSRRKKGKKKKQKTATEPSNANVTDITSGVLDLHLSELSNAETPSTSVAESDMASFMMDGGNDGFRMIRSKANKKKSKTQTSSKKRPNNNSHNNNRKKQNKKRRPEIRSAGSSPPPARVQGQSSKSNHTNPWNRKPPTSIPKTINPRRAPRRERIETKEKPIRVHGTPWNSKPVQTPPAKTNVVVEIEEPEIPKRGMSGMPVTDQLPAPNIPPRLLSPRESQPLETGTPMETTPTVENDDTAEPEPTLASTANFSISPRNDDDFCHQAEEEKSPSEITPMTTFPPFAAASTPKIQPPIHPRTKPPLTSASRPVKPPKFAGGSVPTYMRMSPTKMHTVTLPSSVEPHTGASESSSKSGHSTEDIADSRNSSPASSHQQTIGIQTDPVASSLVDPDEMPTMNEENYASYTPPRTDEQENTATPTRESKPQYQSPSAGLVPQPITSFPQQSQSLPATSQAQPHHLPQQQPQQQFPMQLPHQTPMTAITPPGGQMFPHMQTVPLPAMVQPPMGTFPLFHPNFMAPFQRMVPPNGMPQHMMGPPGGMPAPYLHPIPIQANGQMQPMNNSMMSFHAAQMNPGLMPSPLVHQMPVNHGQPAVHFAPQQPLQHQQFSHPPHLARQQQQHPPHLHPSAHQQR